MLNRKDFILDFIGFFVGMGALIFLIIVLMHVDFYFLILFGILFVYTIIQLVEYGCSILRYIKQSKIKKYSSTKVSIMKYKYLVW